MKLRELQERMAEAAQVPFGRVRTIASELRAKGLLTSGPRGPGAPEMTATDAVNLLLGLMYDGDAADCSVNVPKLRNALVVSSENRGEGGLPDLPYFSARPDGEIYLGDVLDNLLEHLSTHGRADATAKDATAPIVDVTLKVTAPHHGAEINIDSDEALWDVVFSQPHSIEADEAAMTAGDYVQPMLGMFSTRTVYLNALQTIFPNGALDAGKVVPQ